MKYFTDRLRLYKSYKPYLDPLTVQIPIELIYDFINTLDKDDTLQRLKRFKKWPVSKNLIGKQSFQEMVKARTFDQGTFGAEYKKWLQDDAFEDLFLVALGKQQTKSKLLEAYIKNTVITHDLVQFFNGYDTTSLGELNVLCFDLAREWRGSWAFLVFCGGWLSLKLCVKKTRNLVPLFTYIKWCTEAYTRGRRVVDFMYTDWEQMFDLPLDEVKRKVGISDSPKHWNDSKLETYKYVLQNQG